jgi:hypothetical protein
MGTQTGFLEEVIADFDIAIGQHRHAGIVLAAQRCIGIDVDIDQLKAELVPEPFQRLQHVTAEVTATACVHGQLRQAVITRTDLTRLQGP